MAITVTATQGGSTANGLALRVMVLLGAKYDQTGAAAVNAAKAGTTAWTLSITTATGSNVYGALASAVVSGSETMTGSNATVIDNVVDATNNEAYGTFKALNVTSGATTRGVTTGATSSGPLALLEILKQTGVASITEDGSGPAVASTTSATTVTTGSFTPPPGSTLVAIVASDGGVGVTTMTVSDTSGLVWTEASKNNPSGGDYAGVWTAQVPGVAFDAVGPSSAGVSVQTGAVTWSHVNSEAANAIVVGITYITGSSPPATAVTYGAASLARLGTVPSDNQTSGGIDFWGAIGSLPTGSNTVSITNPGTDGTNHVTGGSMSFTSASALKFGSAFTAFASGSSVSASVTGTTANNQIAAACSYGGNALGQIVATSPGTLQWFVAGDGNSGADNSAGQSCVAPDGTQSVGFSVSGGNDWWGLVAVEVQVSTGAPSTPPILVRYRPGKTLRRKKAQRRQHLLFDGTFQGGGAVGAVTAVAASGVVSLQAQVNITVNAGVASSSVVANPPVPAVSVFAGVAVVGVVSNQPGIAVTANAAAAPVGATVVGPIASSAITPGVAIINVKANDQTVSTAPATNAPAEVAIVGVVANQPVPAVTANAGVAVIGAVASQPVVAITANAAVAIIGSVAVQPVVSINANSAVSIIGSVALGPTAAITANAAVAIINAKANDQTVSTVPTTNAPAAVAPVGAVANQAQVNLTVRAEVAVIGAVVPNTTGQVSRTVNAGVAAVGVLALPSTVTLAAQAFAQVAVVLASAPAAQGQAVAAVSLGDSRGGIMTVPDSRGHLIDDSTARSQAGVSATGDSRGHLADDVVGTSRSGQSQVPYSQGG